MPSSEQSSEARLPRRDLTRIPPELWRPPPHTRGRTARDRIASSIRRLFDLQASTIWRDMARVLPTLRGTLVDVGCGAQPYRTLLSKSTRYKGIDRVDAASRFGYAVPDTQYYEGDRWPVEDGGADAVLCVEVLEHVAEPQALLDEARRSLRPGGAIALTVPFAARWHYTPHDYWRFTPSALARLLDRAGFTRVQVYARGNPVTVAAYKAMAPLLPLAMPQTNRPGLRLTLQLAGLLALPPLVVLAIAGNLSLALDYGDDCLGYTVLAVKGPPSGEAAR
jgi:SAM-dependent methyltransferase